MKKLLFSLCAFLIAGSSFAAVNEEDDNINALNAARSGSFTTSCGDTWYYEASCFCNESQLDVLVLRAYAAAERACNTEITQIEF